MSDKALKNQLAAIQANQHKFKQPAKPIQDNTNPQALNVMDELFTRLKAISAVGNAFKTEQEEAIVKQEWMLAFKEEGITKQSIIDDGIESFRVKARKSRSTTWFPSIGEFIDLCLGSDNKLEFAERAYNLFIRREQQIDTVGRMVTASHSFELRQLKAAECKKGFIELYLKFAEDNEIKPLESHLISETVQLSPEQQKKAEKRAQAAQNEFLARFSGLVASNDKKHADARFNGAVQVRAKIGIKTGKIQTETKQSLAQAESERARQLKMIKELL